MGDDDLFKGRPVISNGVLKGYLGSSGSVPVQAKVNYWDSYESDKMIYRDNVGWYTQEAFYGNATQVPVWDDPLFYVAEGGALLNGAFKVAGKLLARNTAQHASTVIVKEIADLSPNNINHIMQKHHMWDKVVSNPNNWDEVSTLLSRAFTHGVEGTRKGVNMRTLRVGDETVAVIYRRMEDGTIRISNGWVLK